MASKRYIMPHDNESAKTVMKIFGEQAYAVVHKERFQAAVKILYGSDFIITEDLSKRMQFSCTICNREMNSENAMQEHYRSGPHQKNRDKRNRETGGASAVIDSYQYAKDSLQFRLLNSQTNPIGLQMIEEYKDDRSKSYYKCFLCGAHGKLSDIYNHIINKPHTEKYIKTSIDLESNILTSLERETLRKYIIDRYGINVEAIKVIRGSEYYPKKWEAEARSFKTNSKIKKEKKEPRSNSPSPSPSSRKVKKERRRSRSISSSPASSRYSRRSPSPSRSYKKSPSRRRSPSPWKRKNRSPSPSISYKGRYSRSPEKSHSRRERRGSSSSQTSRRSQTPESRRYRSKIDEKPSPREKSRVDRDPWEEKQRGQFRNRSPPTSAKVAAQGSSWAIPGPSGSNTSSISSSFARSMAVSTLDKSTQKVNIEDLMTMLNFLVKTQYWPSSTIKTDTDIKTALNTMNTLTKALFEMNILNLEDGVTTEANREMHLNQKEILKNMMGHLKKFMMPAAQIKT